MRFLLFFKSGSVIFSADKLRLTVFQVVTILESNDSFDLEWWLSVWKRLLNIFVKWIQIAFDGDLYDEFSTLQCSASLESFKFSLIVISS